MPTRWSGSSATGWDHRPTSDSTDRSDRSTPSSMRRLAGSEARRLDPSGPPGLQSLVGSGERAEDVPDQEPRESGHEPDDAHAGPARPERTQGRPGLVP